MKENSKLIISIVTALAIIAVVVGATFAYWQWTSNVDEQTKVNFSVPNSTSLLSASLDGGTISVSKIVPVEDCTNSLYATKASVTLTYLNQTSVSAIASGTLAVSSFTTPHGTPSDENLSHLHYALTTNNSSCTTDTITGATGTFAGKATSGSTLFSNIALQSDIAAGTPSTNKTMYLYIWLDKDYEYTNTGSGVVTDSMQDISFILTWSGEITNEQS